ncbi:Xylose isomerase domain protein TIM barrel [Fibrella aestuarina BUZ 2]|uniref:Xylose isomerase domain protein TIM barrel n=1 Tax=Fibrella aestuarina BUZ 2 TaxID=1166018 RepID=I0K5V8_9BACT|nr:sugar phosphate isomerase/epimerase family protein [Fibrella aestuarina]CCG99511.1 Xylose isomerase domain protein TIM barrel [Fibrella aestuarina BUZ 2]
MSQLPASRRSFLKTVSASIPLVTTAGIHPVAAPKPDPVRLSCNLYSFNEPLVNKTMTLEQVLTFCAETGFAAVDPTGYYFPGYPALPDDSYTYLIKRKAFRLGLDISGTGVRNDFTLPDPTRRKAEIDLVRRWIGFAAKLGAPVLRIFSGKNVPEGHSRPEVARWVVDAIGECCRYAAQEGVMLVLQNHADFIETADQLLDILKQVQSDWLAVNLDIGSFKIGDPYAQIAQVAPFAVTWQLKENLFVDGREVETDLTRIVRIVRESGYRGYLPIETLGKGDPRQKVPVFYEKVRRALQG